MGSTLNIGDYAMRKFGKESASPNEKGDKGRDKNGPGWLKNHWCLLSMCAVVIVAFLLRTVFVYGLSSGGGFALSGGSGAQNHLHVVESILNGSFVLGSDAAVNYPIGGLNVVPILMDVLAAGVATILGFFGMTTTESASAALAVLPPVLGALTCIPVYAIGKELFDDKRIGVIAALIFAFLSLPISSTVFSNGTEYALTAFLISCMSYSLIKTVRLMESDASAKKVYARSIVSGVLFGLIALSWNGFGLMILVVGVPLMLQIGVDRINGKNFTKVLAGHSLTLIVGIAIAAVYYIPAGLWDAVFSGPLLLTVLIVLFGFLFRALQSKPWISVIPSLLVVLAVILVAIYFVRPELFSAIVTGNSLYTGIMADMVTNHVSMSNVSAYYGWLTMWLPLCLAIYETYVYLKKERTASQLFMVTWLYMMYFAVWSSYSSAAVVGSVFAVGSAAVIVKVLSRAKIPDWIKTIKSAGFKKVFKPLPLASVLVTALLVIVPNFSFAVDAGMANNDESDHFFSGNTQFVVKTGDSYPMGNLWDKYADENKTGAAVTWIDYIADAVSQGNFNVIADAYGEGDEDTAAMILANGSQGMTAAMMLRLILAGGIDTYKDAIVAAFNEDTFNTLKSYIDNPCEAKKAITDNPDAYGYIRSDINDTNAIYLASVEYLTSNFDVVKISKGYDSVRAASGNAIDYVILDPSLLPLSYNDGNSFSTMAYFAGYSTDGYGAATQFFSYNQYYGYTTYKDAIYDTFVWKAMIGPSATEAGYTSSYSYLYALSASDGSVKAYPGYGLPGYSVDYWQVMYNPDKNATSGSEGWTYMSIGEAIEKQSADGGLINYLSSIVLLKYVGIENSTDVSISTSGASPDGLVIDIYTEKKYTDKDVEKVEYILASSTVVGSDVTVTVPAIGPSDKVVIRNGSVVLASAIGAMPSMVIGAVNAMDVKVIVGNDNLRDSGFSVVLVNVTTKDDVKSFPIDSDGTVDIIGVLPGEYTVDIRDSSGSSVSSSTITLSSGDNSGLVIKPTTYDITVSVKDVNGKPLENELDQYTVYAKETTTGTVYSVKMIDSEDGKVTIAVLPGTYSVYTDYCVAPQTTTITKTSSSVSLVVGQHYSTQASEGEYEYPIYAIAGGYSYPIVWDSVSGKYTFNIPATQATDVILYTVYGTDGEKVVLGTKNDTLSFKEYDAIKVVGKTTAKATVTFINSDRAAVTTVADSDGNYSVYLPAGDYIVNAYSGATKAFLGAVKISADDHAYDIDLVDGRTISVSVRLQSGTSSGYISQPFVYATVTTEYQDVEYRLCGITNSSGEYVFHVPDNTVVKAALGNDSGKFDSSSYVINDFTYEFSSAATNNSKTFYIDRLTESDVNKIGTEDEKDLETKNYSKLVSITSAYDVTLKPYSGSMEYELSAGDTKDIIIGQYTATVKMDDLYFDGKVYIYPATNDPAYDVIHGLDPSEVVKVTLTYNEGDVITVSTEGGKYWHDKNEYWFQLRDDNGEFNNYLITSTNGSGSDKKINYGYIDISSISVGTTLALDVTASEKSMKITGSTGVDGDGEIAVKIGGEIKAIFDVKDGQYTMNVPSTWTSFEVDVFVETTIDGYVYNNEVTGVSFVDLKDGAVRNVAVITDVSEIRPDSDADISVEILDVTLADGKVTAYLRIGNSSDEGTTYVITSGTALVLDKLYSLFVDSNDSGEIVVVGSCSENTVALGDINLTLTVSDINGSGKTTVRLDPMSSSGSVDVDDSSNDVVTASQYRYAVLVKNSDNVDAKTIKLTVTGVTGWVITYTDGRIVNIDGEFIVPGHKDTVLYVCLTSIDGTGTVPGITINVTGDCTKDLSLTPEKLTLSVDSMTASGGDAMDSQSSMPVGVWFMIAVGLILFVATIYLGSKRGVFSRKN